MMLARVFNFLIYGGTLLLVLTVNIVPTIRDGISLKSHASTEEIDERIWILGLVSTLGLTLEMMR